ncbi:unnamed protein product [Caretta caretta]
MKSRRRLALIADQSPFHLMLPCPLKRRTACISYPTSHSFLNTLLSNDEKEDGDDAEPYKCSVLQTIIEEQKITAVCVEDVKHAQMKTTEHPKKLDSLHWGLSVKSGQNHSAGHEVKAIMREDRQQKVREINVWLVSQILHTTDTELIYLWLETGDLTADTNAIQSVLA